MAEKQKRRKKKTTLREKLTNTNTKLRRFILWSFFIVLSLAIVMFNFLQAQVSIQEGDVAAEDIFFEEATASYTSEIKTEEARTAAAATVSPVYKIDNSSLNKNISIIDTYFGAFEEYMLYRNPDIAPAKTGEIGITGETGEGELQLPPQKTTQDLIDEAMFFLGYSSLPEQDSKHKQEVIEYIISMSQAEFVLAKKSLQNAITSVIQPGVTEDELQSARAMIMGNINKASLPEYAIEFITDFYSYCDIQANKFYDAVSTAASVEAARSAVQPVNITVMKGERIITRGTVVTALQIEALKSLNMLKEKPRLLPYIGLGSMILLFYILLIIYVRQYYAQTRKREGNIILIGLLINFTLILTKGISLLPIDNIDIASQIGFLIPIAASSMLLTILIGPGVAIVVSLAVSILIGLVLNNGFAYAVVAMIGSLTGVFCSRNLEHRGQFVSSSLYLSLANMVAITALNLLSEQTYQVIAIGLGFGFANGLISAVLAMGFLPFMESAFKITTAARLTELANSNHPLLKRLMLEAPGTYHHSVLVGNLAETAADAIGADPLVVRVSAYYHDVGKLKRPYFFSENQQPDDNPHDKLSPSLSAMIITSHVKDGVDILRENRFPKEIVDAALSHHGNSVLSFFYHKAEEQTEDPTTIRKEDYTYRGKLPDTKELAIVCLADGVQAAVQALNTNDAEAIERRVRSVIKSRIDEGMLAASPLTFGDIELITQNFVRVLSGMTHSRVEYPEQVAKELAEKNAASAEGGKE